MHGCRGTGKNDAIVRVLLTGRETEEAAATKVKTRKQRQVRRDSIEGGREGEFDSFNDAGYWLPCEVHTARA